MRMGGKIQRGDGQTGFVGCIVIQRISVCNGRRADHRQMRMQRGQTLKRKGIMAGHDDDSFIQRILQIQVSSKIVVSGFEADGSTHAHSSCGVLFQYGVRKRNVCRD